jgi:hypothetical protein
MAVERVVGGTSLVEVVDRILDKGIVIDAWVCVSLIGIEILTVEARVVIASVDTFLHYSERIRQIGPVARPAIEHRKLKALPAHLAALPVPRHAGQRRGAVSRH